ncbi:MAG: TetR/AcrR family transcriptional regulator [Rhizobacter sp.]|nr:TetR/AcrR family transcriptional regulator [Burkholderiales bacterium]
MFTPDAPPQTARFQEKREAILGAAATLFNERGVKGATLADIAGRVGLVTNSVTYYYRKKEDLATACFLRTIEIYDGFAIEAASEKTATLRLRSFFRKHAELLASIELNQAPQIVVFNDLRALPNPQLDIAFSVYTDMFRRIRTLLKGPETSGLTRDALNARTHIVLSTTNWMRSWIGRFEADEYTRIADRMTDIVINGFAGNKSQWRAAEAEPSWQPKSNANDASDTAEAFLRAATFLVNEQGYRGASVDKISARLNVTKGSFYHHNDNKQDLISACFDRTFSVVRQALSLAETGPGSGWDRACAAARALVRYQLSEDGPLLRSSATSALPDQVHRDSVRKTMARLTERMACVVVDGMMDGSIRPLDPAIAALVAIGVINASAELQRWAPSANIETASDLYVRPVFAGLFCA